MDLHRTGRVPQWETMPTESWNIWQQWAHRTNGWLTPGNMVTALGNILTFFGIYQLAAGNLVSGVLYVGLGRMGDFLDGRVAARTKTKSPLGEALDAGFDKIQIFVALPILLAKHMIPLAPGLALVAEQLSISMFGALAKHQNRVMHPTLRGKFATGTAWMAFILFCTASELDGDTASRFNTWAHPLQLLAYLAMVTSLVLGITAIYGYGNDAFRGRKVQA